METKEAILATISELSKEDFSAESSAEVDEKSALDSAKLEQNAESSADSAKSALDSAPFKNPIDSAKKIAESSAESSNIFIDIKEEVEDIEGGDDEVALLSRMKEKSLVLFEGLKSAQNSDKSDVLAMKVEMVISYLEYQLFVIEERLENLKGENK